MAFFRMFNILRQFTVQNFYTLRFDVIFSEWKYFFNVLFVCKSYCKQYNRKLLMCLLILDFRNLFFRWIHCISCCFLARNNITTNIPFIIFFWIQFESFIYHDGMWWHCDANTSLFHFQWYLPTTSFELYNCK